MGFLRKLTIIGSNRERTEATDNQALKLEQWQGLNEVDSQRQEPCPETAANSPRS